MYKKGDVQIVFIFIFVDDLFTASFFAYMTTTITTSTTKLVIATKYTIYLKSQFIVFVVVVIVDV